MEDQHQLTRTAPGEVDASKPFRLILHAGLPKTGSKSIQAALSGAYGRLLAAGMLYPFGMFGDRQHSLLTNIVRMGSDNDLANFFLSLRQLTTRNGCSTVILSGEHISVLKAHELKRMRPALAVANFEPLVILFTRPRMLLYRSTMSQRMLSVRDSFVTPFSLFKVIGKYDVEDVCETFVDVFGQEKVIRHELKSGDDAVQLIAGDLRTELPTARRRNTSTDFAVMSLINSIKADFDFSSTVIHAAYDAAFGRARHRFTGERRFMQEMLEHFDPVKRSSLAGELPEERKAGWTREEQIQYLRQLEKFIAHLRRYHAWTPGGRRQAREARRRRSLERLGIGAGEKSQN